MTMKMRTQRKLRTIAPRRAIRALGRRREFDVSDATMEPEPGPLPEAVFDRVTGPYGRRYGAYDEET
jgi:hypothetical protein